MFCSACGAREGIPKILILLTDGKNTVTVDFKKNTEQLKVQQISFPKANTNPKGRTVLCCFFLYNLFLLENQII